MFNKKKYYETKDSIYIAVSSIVFCIIFVITSCFINFLLIEISLDIFFSCFILSSIFCVLLQKEWFQFRPFSKIPLYMTLSICLSFSFIFTFFDILTIIVGFFQVSYGKALIESEKQVQNLLFFSVLSGAVMGLLFGLLIIEDKGEDFEIDFLEGGEVFLPFMIIFGLLCGGINEHLRQRGEILHFKPIKDPFQEEI